MYMNMCIIMTMNIYITPANEKYLRSLDTSMSGYINNLIAMDMRSTPPPEKEIPFIAIGNNEPIPENLPPEIKEFLEKNRSGADAPEDEWKEVGTSRPTEKLPCCNQATPCRHWVWDSATGDGYKNSITGETRGADYE